MWSKSLILALGRENDWLFAPSEADILQSLLR